MPTFDEFVNGAVTDEDLKPTAKEVRQLVDQVGSQLLVDLMERTKNIKPKILKTGPVNVAGDTPVLVLSDLHIGKRINSIYSMDVAMAYVESIFEKYIAIVNSMPNCNKINILMLGDNIEGEGIIYPEQAWNIDDIVIKQLDVIARMIWGYIIALAEKYPVQIYGIPGNHGRTNGARETNWDNILYLIFKLLSNNTKLPIAIDVGLDGYISFKIKDHIYYARHRLPKIGAASSKSTLLGYAHNYHANVLIGGHWHTPMYTCINDVHVVGASSIVPRDDLAEQMGVDAYISQLVFDVTKNYSITNIRYIKP